MKSKLFLLASVVYAFVGVLCTSCQSDDDSEIRVEEKLLGSWVAPPDDDGDFYEYVFSASGEIMENIYVEGRIEDVFKGTYTVQDSTITFSFTSHQEVPHRPKEYIQVFTARFRIEGKQLFLYAPSTDESVILTKK